MSSTFTTNKGIEKPGSGDYVNAWAAPINADFDDIDTALGGNTAISVTGVGAGTIALTLSQYKPPNIEFTGVLAGNLNYQIPAGIGGMWSLSNSTTGSFSLVFSVNAGGSLVLTSGRTLVVSDGVNIQLADAATAVAAETAAIAAAAASAASLYVSLSTNVGSMHGVTIALDPGTTPSGSPGQLFLYY